ncbi:hypothetical protein FMUND_5723 [Fusarium mundagurra]|uniref:Uncharacterized protein n=1 Tax=Fusarium mundagurra TaxID=1567541 RepID=A0A8H5YSA8_9HYPO|nr:hypothetical protein FMUND_5723 [Fusarium mundagurra]
MKFSNILIAFWAAIETRAELRTLVERIAHVAAEMDASFAYCGCDRTGAGQVQWIDGFWTEIQVCETGTYKGYTANGSGTHCEVVLG